MLHQTFLFTTERGCGHTELSLVLGAGLVPLGFCFVLMVSACAAELKYVTVALKIILWPFPLHFSTQCCAFLGFFLPNECLILHPFCQIVPTLTPVLKFLFPLCFSFFPLCVRVRVRMFVCVCEMCMWGCVHATACICYIYGQRITLCSLPHSSPLCLLLGLSSGFRGTVRVLPTEPPHLSSLCFIQTTSYYAVLIAFKLTMWSRQCSEVFFPQLPACWDNTCVELCLAFDSFLNFKLSLYVRVWVCTCEGRCLQARRVGSYWSCGPPD